MQGNSDERRLQNAEAARILSSLGFSEADIAKMSRWEKVAQIRHAYLTGAITGAPYYALVQ